MVKQGHSLFHLFPSDVEIGAKISFATVAPVQLCGPIPLPAILASSLSRSAFIKGTFLSISRSILATSCIAKARYNTLHGAFCHSGRMIGVKITISVTVTDKISLGFTTRFA